MAINKKLIGGLLGGGVAITVASFGGLKINDRVAWNKKIARYSKIPSGFWRSGLTKSSDEGNWYLPNYLDDVAWKHWHEVKDSGEGEGEKRKNFLKEYPNWESFRNYCYAKAESGYEECSDSKGWCMECARNDGWDWDKARKANK
ncbi:hypothetical protein A6V39_05425 [Candidatus Mycoplasma haematobovis]|uniref:Uncharacterized protein n=1 Tax=Candidatus Mycoplasma haematobovis TaxID=432608 RepID=A0A1A9QCB7_9MOLU|nr:hypothetical protein [Candidatus Mycoplasma haematobovis]OAL09734.1 hypothetical protein A6V39_05425 [Candidatus Mycoplasma haematobovis]